MEEETLGFILQASQLPDPSGGPDAHRHRAGQNGAKTCARLMPDFPYHSRWTAFNFLHFLHLP
jgi:hypothetical protein